VSLLRYAQRFDSRVVAGLGKAPGRSAPNQLVRIQDEPEQRGLLVVLQRIEVAGRVSCGIDLHPHVFCRA
jgi:hypothetical protein